MTSQVPRSKSAKRKTALAIRRLFVALNRAIEATDDARQARDELAKLGSRKPTGRPA